MNSVIVPSSLDFYKVECELQGELVAKPVTGALWFLLPAPNPCKIASSDTVRSLKLFF